MSPSGWQARKKQSMPCRFVSQYLFHTEGNPFSVGPLINKIDTKNTFIVSLATGMQMYDLTFSRASSRRPGCGVVWGLVPVCIHHALWISYRIHAPLRSSNTPSSSHTNLSGFLLFTTQILVQIKRYSLPWMPLIRRIVKTQLQKVDDTQAPL